MMAPKIIRYQTENIAFQSVVTFLIFPHSHHMTDYKAYKTIIEYHQNQFFIIILLYSGYFYSFFYLQTNCFFYYSTYLSFDYPHKKLNYFFIYCSLNYRYYYFQYLDYYYYYYETIKIYDYFSHQLYSGHNQNNIGIYYNYYYDAYCYKYYYPKYIYPKIYDLW